MLSPEPDVSRDEKLDEVTGPAPRLAPRDPGVLIGPPPDFNPPSSSLASEKDESLEESGISDLNLVPVGYPVGQPGRAGPRQLDVGGAAPYVNNGEYMYNKGHPICYFTTGGTDKMCIALPPYL